CCSLETVTRLIQIQKGDERRGALGEEPRPRLLESARSIYSLSHPGNGSGKKISEAAQDQMSDGSLDYDSAYESPSGWGILRAIDHPEPARCLVSGTGLTHLGSARDRQAMHAKADSPAQFENLTDSMKMFRWGLDGGRPASGSIGTPPEWFYKGTGGVL